MRNFLNTLPVLGTLGGGGFVIASSVDEIEGHAEMQKKENILGVGCKEAI